MPDEAKSPPAPPKKEEPEAPRSWGEPLRRFDAAWTRLDTRLATAVVIAEIVLLVVWAVLKSLTRDHHSDSQSAVVVRILLSLAAAGGIAHIVARVKAARAAGDAGAKWVKHGLVIAPMLFLVYVAAWSWGRSSVAYTSNVLNWIQNASMLAFLGGLRGVVTRLTLWVALIGASIATSKGKHINVDLVVRALKPKMRIPAAIVSSSAAILVCLGAVLAFSDSIAIAQFHAPATEPCAPESTEQCETPAGKKIEVMKMQLGKDLFLFGRQASLDMKTLPRVIAGEPYDQYMTASMWNAWMREADWTAYYPKEAVDGQLLDEKDTARRRQPAVNVPGAAEATFGLLLREINFVFPFGMFMIGLRFLVRILLILSRHVTVDPDAVHGDEELTHGHDNVDIPESATGKGGA
jgi:TRAP-type C4-dicarboxylate transport system permease small subunit